MWACGWASDTGVLALLLRGSQRSTWTFSYQATAHIISSCPHRTYWNASAEIKRNRERDTYVTVSHDRTLPWRGETCDRLKERSRNIGGSFVARPLGSLKPIRRLVQKESTRLRPTERRDDDATGTVWLLRSRHADPHIHNSHRPTPWSSARNVTGKVPYYDQKEDEVSAACFFLPFSWPRGVKRNNNDRSNRSLTSTDLAVDSVATTAPCLLHDVCVHDLKECFYHTIIGLCSYKIWRKANGRVSNCDSWQRRATSLVCWKNRSTSFQQLL